MKRHKCKCADCGMEFTAPARSEFCGGCAYYRLQEHRATATFRCAGVEYRGVGRSILEALATARAA